ncbi:MAG: hypothetical protein AB7T31_05360 [Gemmatimonadales bacterium]
MRGVASTFEGTLTSVAADALSITLRDGRSFTFQASQLERAEVLASRRNTRKGAVVGGFVGLGVGVGLVASDGIDPRAVDGDGDELGRGFDPWKLIVPPIAGAAVGALVGSRFRTPRWAPAVLPDGTRPADFALGWIVPVAW